MSRSLRLAAALFVLLSTPVLAQVQPPFQLKNINTESTQRGSNPSNFAVLAPATVLFAASDDFHGEELYRSEGTTGVMVLDIAPGKISSTPRNFAVLGSTAFFTADDGTTGVELWKTDGTAAGTVLVKDICPNSCSSTPENLTFVNGTLFFSANDGLHGAELWRSDGTAVGTFMVRDISPGSVSSAPGQLVAFNSALYFTATYSPTGRELYKSDGTEAGTVLLADINASYLGASSGISSLTAANGALWFGANDGINGPSLWKSDGTTAGTVLVKTGVVIGSFGSTTPPFIALNGTVVFRSAIDGSLYATDGTSAGTIQLNAAGLPGNDATILGPYLYFGAAASPGDAQLWRSDGTIAGTTLVKNINSSAASFPGNFATVGSKIYFSANDGVTGTELWTSDGTGPGTQLLRDIRSGAGGSSPSSLTPFGSSLVFSANDGTSSELWISNGTTAGTAPLRINSDIASSAPDAARFVDYHDQVFFSAISAAVEGTELWKSDGTTAGTRLVTNTFDHGPLGDVTPLDVASGYLFLAARTPALGLEIMASDGTGIFQWTTEINPGTADSATYASSTHVAYNGKEFFVANDGVHGFELWSTTGLVRDVFPGPDSSSIRELVVSNGILFFVAEADGTHSSPTLWKTDGTEAGTVFLAEIGWGSGRTPTPSNSLTDLNGTLLFVADSNGLGVELWKSDGTPAGTVMVKDIAPGLLGSTPVISAVLNGYAYFSATDGAHGIEPWRTDGTAANTVMIKDINPGEAGAGSNVSEFAPFGNVLLFSASNGTIGQELWRTDGTAAGTVLVKDICPGACPSSPTGFAIANGRAYFQARDLTHGEELWTTDGTTAGTSLVADLEPGIGASAPRALHAAGNLVFFEARTSAAGEEPWVACAGLTSHFTFSGPASYPSGGGAPITVIPSDASNAYVPCYVGTVHFTSNDPSGLLPPDYTFVAGEGGHDFFFTFSNGGTHTITVTDTVTGTIVGTISIVISGSIFTSTMSASPTAIAADGISTSTITVRYRDIGGSPMTTGGGTVTLATDYGVLSNVIDQGNGTFTAMLTSSTLLQTATITGTIDGFPMAARSTVDFIAGPAARLILSAPAFVTADVPFGITVTAGDAQDHLADTYSGTIHFTSTDTSGAAIVPGDYAFQPSDQGTRGFPGVKIHTVGTMTMAVVDQANPSVKGTAQITVRGTTSTVVTSNANPAGPASNVTFTATISTTAFGALPGGTVTFRDGGTIIGTSTATAGVAVFTSAPLGRFPHSITAQYAGDTNYFGSGSPNFTLYVTLPATVMSADYSSSANRITVTWTPAANAVNCLILRSSNNSGFAPVATVPSPSTVYQDATISPNTTYLYRVQLLDSGGNPGDPSGIDPATTMAFTDDPAVAGATVIKALHITELRAAIDAFRAAAGLGAASYTNSAIASGDPIRAVDWSEMRARLEEARLAIPGLNPIVPYTDPTLTPGMPPRAAHVNELRNRVK